jgi:uncharacterized protein with HEPN domain
MQLEQRNAALLWDILEAARRAIEFAQRALEIVGEAANRLSKEFQEAHPEIPWRKMVGLRNVLIHEYGEIDHALVWTVVQEHLPVLVAQIEPLLPPLPPG